MSPLMMHSLLGAGIGAAGGALAGGEGHRMEGALAGGALGGIGAHVGSKARTNWIANAPVYGPPKPVYNYGPNMGTLAQHHAQGAADAIRNFTL